MMEPSLIVGGIPFYDAPSEIEGSPYWVDLWTDINGYKIGLQVKPTTYRSASMSIYTGKARASEEDGHKEFMRVFGGKVFIVMPEKGKLPSGIEKRILEERDLLLRMPAKIHQ